MNNLGIESYGEFLVSFSALESVLLKNQVAEKTLIKYIVDGLLPKDVCDRVRVASEAKKLHEVKFLALNEIILCSTNVNNNSSLSDSSHSFVPPHLRRISQIFLHK